MPIPMGGDWVMMVVFCIKNVLARNSLKCSEPMSKAHIQLASSMELRVLWEWEVKLEKKSLLGIVWKVLMYTLSYAFNHHPHRVELDEAGGKVAKKSFARNCNPHASPLTEVCIKALWIVHTPHTTPMQTPFQGCTHSLATPIQAFFTVVCIEALKGPLWLLCNPLFTGVYMQTLVVRLEHWVN